MFDQIGTFRDDEATKRRAASTLIASIVLGGGAAFLLAAGAWTANKVLDESVALDPAMAELMLEDEPDVPAQPPAPAKRGGGQEAQKGTPDAEPEATPSPVPAPLSAAVDTEVRNKAVRGERDGTGDDESTVKGPPGPGRPDGEGDGKGTGTLRVFHHAELNLRRRSDPIHPQIGLGDQVCMARVSISDEGRPTEVLVEGCDSAYVEATQKALMRWRWSRPKSAGVPTAALTTYRIVFKEL